jgi:1-acyl-sn-glycerol-3-phosphate acyltransferase
MEPIYSGVIVFARGVFAVHGLRFERTGSEHIPGTGGAVIAMNHIGYFDFCYAGYSALDVGRRVRFMAKKETFDNRFTRPIMRGCRHIAVDRGQGADAYTAAVEYLRAGELVGVYPEATISRAFVLKDFKSGAARMALEAQVPIIPCIVWGAHRVWTKDHPKRLGRNKIPFIVRYGRPLTPVGTATELEGALRDQMSTILRAVQLAYPHPEGEYWVPAEFGGGAPTLDEAKRLDEAELAERARRATEHH